MKTKVCTKCGVEKPLSEFYKNKGGKYEVRGDCKECYGSYNSKYYGKNKEIILKQQLQYYEENKEETLKRQAIYRNSERGAIIRRLCNQRRRTKVRKLEKTLTVDQWYLILELQKNQCAKCKDKFTNNNISTQDHIVPVVNSGPFTVHNIQALCQSCNSKKKTKTIDYRTKEHKQKIMELYQ